MPDPSRHIENLWIGVLSSMKKLNTKIDVRPKDPNLIFRRAGSSAGGSCFEIQPTVFLLPERSSHRTADLYVVVSGQMVFEPLTAASWRTAGFATRIAYFRMRPGVLDHTCGLHYDFDTSLAHPVFHVQFRSQADMRETVEKEFRPKLSLRQDAMKDVIQTVRIPTAQMDFFSVVLQLCADHLVGKDSQKPVTSEFLNLRSTIAESMSGACATHPGLSAARSAKCSRAPHWYLNARPA